MQMWYANILLTVLLLQIFDDKRYSIYSSSGELTESQTKILLRNKSISRHKNASYQGHDFECLNSWELAMQLVIAGDAVWMSLSNLGGQEMPKLLTHVKD